MNGRCSRHHSSRECTLGKGGLSASLPIPGKSSGAPGPGQPSETGNTADSCGSGARCGAVGGLLHELSAFAVGRMPAAAREATATHIEECAACLATLHELEDQDDTLLCELRKPVPAELLTKEDHPPRWAFGPHSISSASEVSPSPKRARKRPFPLHFLSATSPEPARNRISALWLPSVLPNARPRAAR
jgi:hypothetical protein